MRLDVVALLLFSVLLVTGQVLFKIVGLAIRHKAAAEAIRIGLASPALYSAAILYGLTTILWIWILSRVPLSRAYPWVAIGMAVVPMVSVWLFHERVGPLFWVGVMLIAGGIILTQLGYHPS